MYKLIRALENVTDYTRKEITRDIEKRLAVEENFRAQITRDLRRVGGDYGFQNEQCYRKLKEKYLRGHQSRKKLALLEMERRQWCHVD